MKWIILGSISIICIAAIVFGIWLIYSPPYKEEGKKNTKAKIHFFSRKKEKRGE